MVIQMNNNNLKLNFLDAFCIFCCTVPNQTLVNLCQILPAICPASSRPVVGFLVTKQLGKGSKKRGSGTLGPCPAIWHPDNYTKFQFRTGLEPLRGIHATSNLPWHAGAAVACYHDRCVICFVMTTTKVATAREVPALSFFSGDRTVVAFQLAGWRQLEKLQW